VVINCWNCLSLRLLPPRHAWGRPVWSRFKELFVYSKDVFLIHLGSLLIMASQSVIISRTMGLVAVAAWVVGTKAFTFASQLIYQFYDFSEPAFSEMIVRGEQERLRTRFSGILVVSGAIGAIAVVIYASCNSTFVTVWTAGKISWSGWNDVLLGCWLIVTILLHANNCFIVLSRRIGFLRYVYILEGLVFVFVANMVGRQGGFVAIIGTSILCSACFSAPYGVKRINAYFGFRFPGLQLPWLLATVKVLGIMVPVALVLWYVGQWFSPVTRLAVNALVLSPLGLALLLRYGTTREMRAEVLGHVPRLFQPALATLFGTDG
jgi:O-antigen/teichoic acid export membrane protein